MPNLQGRPARSLQGMYRSLQGWTGSRQPLTTAGKSIAVGSFNSVDYVFIIDVENNKIIRYLTNGTPSALWDYVSSGFPSTMRVVDDELFVAGNNVIDVFTFGGTLKRQLTVQGDYYDIVGETIYVADNVVSGGSADINITSYDFEGTEISSFTLTGTPPIFLDMIAVNGNLLFYFDEPTNSSAILTDTSGTTLNTFNSSLTEEFDYVEFAVRSFGKADSSKIYCPLFDSPSPKLLYFNSYNNLEDSSYDALVTISGYSSPVTRSRAVYVFGGKVYLLSTRNYSGPTLLGTSVVSIIDEATLTVDTSWLAE